MHKRLLLLTALLLLVGFVTKAFAAGGAEPLTRASAVALLVKSDPVLQARALHFQEHRPPMKLFDDIDYAQWYAPFVEAAFEAGLITGNTQRLFRPGALLREEEAVALTARYTARTNASVARSLNESTAGTWLQTVSAAATNAGLKISLPLRLGQPISKNAYVAMLSSAGLAVAAPSTVVAATETPQVASGKPAPVVQQRVVPTTAVAPQRVQPTVRTTVPAQRATTTTATVAPAVSTKAFAITMPSLGIKDLSVIHPTNASTKDGLLAPLKSGVGHLFSYPGKGGTILIYGHSSSYAWDVSNYTKIFRQINKLSAGDLIYVTYGGKQYTYRVSYKHTVDAGDMSAYQQGSGEQLILYTCWPPDSIKQRYLVHAVPTTDVASR